MITYLNRANTLRSADPTITTPTEIAVETGAATARHPDTGDVDYASLDALCAAYGLSVEDVLALPTL